MPESRIKKIVIIGPESTGKSTLCQQLAAHYQTSWCPEYAREYLLQNGKAYTYPTLLTIARGQLFLEDSLTNSLLLTPNSLLSSSHSLLLTPNSLLILDTNLYVIKVWSEYVFGKCDPFILEQIVAREYHLYLLCNLDLPWIKDELREYPDEGPRKELYQIYKDLLVNQHVPWVEITGQQETRTQQAIRAIDAFLISED